MLGRAAPDVLKLMESFSEKRKEMGLVDSC
jgi:hypothetical protein